MSASCVLQRVLGCVLVTLVCSSSSADIMLINPGTDDRVSAITDVGISGTDFDGVYDFYFHYDTTFNEFEALHAPGSSIVWTNTSQAGSVLDTLTDMVIAFGDVGATRTTGMLLPRGVISATHFDPVIQIDQVNNYSQWNKDAFLQGGGLSRTQNFGSQVAFLSTSVAASSIPEPSAMVALAVVVICFAGSRLRRKNHCTQL